MYYSLEVVGEKQIDIGEGCHTRPMRTTGEDGRWHLVGTVVVDPCSECEEDVCGDPEEREDNDGLGDGTADFPEI